MNQTLEPVVSNLPVAAFVVPMAAGLLVLLAKPLGRVFWQAVDLLTSAATFALGLVMAFRVVDGVVLTAWANELRVDALSALLVLVIGGVGFLATWYSLRYVAKEDVAERLGSVSGRRRLWMFHWLLPWFLGTMVWGCVTNNLIMLYVAVEATTLASGLLVAFFWDKRALEAGYKYLMLLTIALTFALFGCVLIYAASAATGALTGGDALLMSEVRRVIPGISAGTAAIAVAFLLVGFGAKAGIAPFHLWLPDAHAEAPAPISVLLSGVMIKMAVYALARTVSLFLPTWSAVSVFLVALGAFSMLLGIILALSQDDLKRLLAYSSVSQMGYVLVGLGLGTYLGAYGGLFHLLNHAIGKGLLFMCAGALIYATGAKRLSELGGLRRKLPITAACFFFGAIAISGLPPFNGFMSKLTVYIALADAGMWWAVVIALITGVLTVVVLMRAAVAVFWRESPTAELATVREVPAAMWLPMVILAAACLLLGVFPQAPFPLLDKAATVLATLGH